MASTSKYEMMEWTVRPSTLKRYRQSVIHFSNWCRHHGDDTNDIDEFDELLLEYIYYLYQNKNGKSKASTTLYGIQLYLPQVKLKLPRSLQALKGWNKHVPGSSYPPLTWELTVVIAVQLCRHDKYQYGVGILLAFDCFFRISELCDIKHKDIADDGDRRISSEHKGMMIRLPTTKTGKNQWVTVEDQDVKHLVRTLLKRTKPGDKLFPFSTSSFRIHMKNVCAELGLSSQYTPHSLRHGGATRYRHVLGWSIENVTARGRWSSSMSSRRYIQSGKALLLTMSAPPEINHLGSIMVKDITGYLTSALPQKHI